MIIRRWDSDHTPTLPNVLLYPVQRDPERLSAPYIPRQELHPEDNDGDVESTGRDIRLIRPSTFLWMVEAYLIDLEETASHPYLSLYLLTREDRARVKLLKDLSVEGGFEVFLTYVSANDDPECANGSPFGKRHYVDTAGLIHFKDFKFKHQEILKQGLNTRCHIVRSCHQPVPTSRPRASLTQDIATGRRSTSETSLLERIMGNGRAT